MIYCYFELCEKIWAGSPAIEQIDGVETVELNSLQDDNDEGEEKQGESSGNQSTTTDLQTDNRDDSSTTQLEGSEDVAVTTDQEIGRKRRTQLNSTLDSYKQQKLKKKMPADTQLVHFAEEELLIKKQMMERFESVSKDHKDTMNQLTSNLKTLSDSVTNAFSVLQQILLHPRPGPIQQPFQYQPAASHSSCYGPRGQYMEPPSPISASPSPPFFQPIPRHPSPYISNHSTTIPQNPFTPQVIPPADMEDESQ